MTTSVHQPHVPVPRLASSYKPIVKGELASTEYPCALPSLIPSLHDVQYYQAIMSNDRNFATTTKCDIFELKQNEGVWQNGIDEAGLAAYLETCNDTPQRTTLRAIFCTLDNTSETTYGVQIAMTKSNVGQLLGNFNVSPQFVPLLLAEPDYWSPGDFASHDSEGNLKQLEFFCQQPRWIIHKRQTPWCIYMTHDVKLATTTYIVVCSDQYPSSLTIKSRLIASFAKSSSAPNSILPACDPYLLHCMITHEAFVEAKGIITELRHRLYDQLDKVDAYAENPSERKQLEHLTIKLHGISQDTDSLLASADMAEMIATRMQIAHGRYEMLLGEGKTPDQTVKVRDSLLYLQASVQSQKRWLLSYKSRKDIAMNLVFNLVTQQDSATTTLIALETKADSSSMKTIAAMTMIFLPGTYMSSVFAMKSTEHLAWWVYVVITLPLTATVVATWWVWTRYQVVKLLKSAISDISNNMTFRRRKLEESKV